MTKQKFVTIEKDDEQAQVLPESVEVWEENGWTVLDDESSDEVDEAPVPVPGDPGGFGDRVDNDIDTEDQE